MHNLLRRVQTLCRSRAAQGGAVVLCFCLLYFNLFASVSEVQLVAQTDEPSRFRLYWADEGQSYSRARHGSVQLKAGEEREYRFLFADLADVRKLRIDPTERRAQIRIRKLIIAQAGYHPIRLERAEDFAALQPLKAIGAREATSEGLLLATAGKDAQLELAVRPRMRLPTGREALRFLTLLALLAGFLVLQPRLGQGFGYVPAGLALAAGLALCMATLSKPDEHPDEHVHLAAGKYYETHWLPPEVCAPEIRDSYSVYGASRLDSGEIVYLLAGKLSRLLEALPIAGLERHQRLRLFNVALLAILAGLALLYAGYRPLLLPLLISPQIWYLFSYFNSDAFALFVTVLCAGQLLCSDSWLNRYWEAPRGGKGGLMAIALGGLLVLSILIKKNFFIVHGALLMLIVLQAMQSRQQGTLRPRLLQGAKLALVAVVLLGVHYAGIYSVRGADESEAVRRCREQIAGRAFKSSTEVAEQHPTLHLRQRGVSWQEIFSEHRWAEKSFRSAFGVYGYLSISDSPIFYRVVKALTLLLLATLLVSALWRTTAQEQLVAGGCMLLSLALTAALFWHAWTGDMQAQGRYFLPVAVLVGILAHQQQQRVNRLVLDSLTIGLYLLGLYSFVFVALTRIPKL